MGKPKRIRWDETRGGAQNAQRELPALIAAYFALGRKTLAGKLKTAELHALRLQTKRLRYTLELFRPCYGPGFRARLAALRRLQQYLGQVNDCATASTVLAGILRKNSAPSRRLERLLRQRSATRIAKFRREWMQVFDAPGQEQRWTGYFARHARPPGRK